MDEKLLFETLKKWWGYDSLRQGQREVIESVLNHTDTLALMPTGAGKSLLYQLPTMMRPGLCIVVTPLISLMKDQVDSLHNHGIQAVAIHSGMTQRSIDIALDNCVYGDVKFLYIAPERIISEIFSLRVRKMNVGLIAIDEAHCICQWGYDFRPSYLTLAMLREKTPEATVLALTASATPDVARDIMDKLKFKEGREIRSDFARANLSFAVRKSDDKIGQLMRVIQNVEGSSIVYMRTREGTEKLTEKLKSEGLSVNYYHGGLPHAERGIRQDEWQSGKTRIMVATNAFGMGINKADVRSVVHYDVPSSLEEYYQEAGRAGRDGKRSYAVLLSASDEKAKVENRYRSEFPPIEEIRTIYAQLCSYLEVPIGEGKGYTFVFDIYDFCRRTKRFTWTVTNAIKILQSNGYLWLTDEAENAARLMFCVSRDDLYDFRVDREEMDGILRTILRLYAGVFTDFRPIDIQEIALYSGYRTEQVREQLKQLWRLHVIRYIPKNYSPLLRLTCERLPEADVYISPQTYSIRKDAAAIRIRNMFEYIDDGDKCRSVMLQNYFGQEQAEDCGCCDNCIEKKKRCPSSREKEILRLVSAEDLTVNELVKKFKSDPAAIIAEVDRMTEKGKISISTCGIVTINR